MPRKRLYAYVWVMAAVLLATGCDQKSDSEKFSAYVEQAQQKRDAGDLDAAAIHLKNALQIRPEHARARRALGELHLARGQAEAAVKEFERAIDYGASAAEVEPQLARAYLATGKAEQALDVISQAADGSDGATDPERLTVMGLALERLGQLDRAEAAFEAVLENDQSAEAAVGLARVHMARNEVEPARQAVERALGIAPDNQAAQFLQSRLLLAEGDTAAAQEVLTGLVERDPPMLAAGTTLIETYLGEGKRQSAWDVLERLEAVYPKAPGVQLFSAIKALSADDTDAAKRITDQLLGQFPTFQRAQLVAGIANLRLGHNEQARSSLRNYVNARPEDGAARLLLAQALLRLDDQESARDLLANAQGQAASEMVRLLRRAGADLPDGQRQQTLQLAAAIEGGNSFDSPGQFPTPEGQDQGATAEAWQRVMRAVREQRYEDAFAFIEGLKEEQPASYLPYQLEAVVYFQQNRLQEAEAALREARDRAPNDAAVAILLSETLRRQDRARDAMEVLADARDKAPANEALALSKARLHAALGEPEQVRAVLTNVISQNPEAYRARLYLGRFHLLNQAPDRAVEVLEPALEAAPNEPAILEVLGRAWQAQGDNERAIAIFRRLVEAAPDQAESHRLAGEALIQANRPADAVSYLETAVGLADQPKRAQMLLARAYVLAGEHDKADGLLSKLKASYSDEADVHVLSAQNNFRGPDTFEQALDDIERALELDPSAEYAVTRARMQVASGRRTQAIADLQEWLAERSGEPRAERALGELLLSADRYGEAARVYQGLLEAGQNDVGVLNNLAWALTKAGRAEAGIEYAAQAASKAPSNPDVLDTYGVALRAGGQTDGAIEKFKQARAQAPERPDITLHLLDALVAGGKPEEARELLNSINEDEFSNGMQKELNRLREALER